MTLLFRNIATVCTGNICRSPMAEALFRERLSADGARVSSVGIGALVGAPADPMASELMAERGLDLSAHRGRQASNATLSDIDLVLVAEQLHSDWLTKHFPALRGRVHKLGRWLENRDIADPYKRPRAAFEVALNEIEDSVEAWLPRLRG